MKKVLLFVTMITCVMVHAQNSNRTAINRCGSYEVYQQMLKNDPTFAKNQKAIEDFTQAFIKKGDETDGVQAVKYTIPVVVHVVWHTSVQNISDAQVQSQIDVLNEDYQKLNADVSGVPSVFKSLVANCKTSFCLATVDPTGNATTGIVRVQTSTTSFSTNNNVKYTSKGGDDAWPAADYLNIWVCNLGGGLLGYAQFPGGPPATDGVVILHSGFGTTGTAAYPYNLGRTATHEIGHWLNLRHIWGDDGGACTGSDLVDDTPNQGNYNFGCPHFPKISCSNGPNGEMFMNYMDYTDDRCMFMFSKGQQTRMKATLKSGGSRHSVTISGKCGTHALAISQNIIVQNMLSVMPNPVNSGYANVSYKLDKAAHVQLIVSNIYGNELASVNAGNQVAGNHQQKLAEFSRLENGIYVMKLIANGEQIAASRFVVNK